MNLTVSSTHDSVVEIFYVPTLLLEEQREQLQPIIDKIQCLSEVTFSRIALPTIKFCIKNFKQKPYLKCALKIIAVLAYLIFWDWEFLP